MNTPKRRVRLAAGLITLTLLAAACGGDDSSSETTDGGSGSETTDGGSGGEGGEVFVTGSSTVEPISIRVAEKAEAAGIAAVVEGPGTGDGFKKFCAGEGDVTGASRQIKDEEIALCEEAGIEYVELAVGIDGLTVATSPENEAVACLDVPALYALLGPESEGKVNWSDANELAAELAPPTPNCPTRRSRSAAPVRRAAPTTRSWSSSSPTSPKSAGPTSSSVRTTPRAPTTT